MTTTQQEQQSTETIGTSSLVNVGLTHDEMASPAYFKRELETIFTKNWQFVGHVSEVTKPGDFLRWNLGDVSVLVVRGRGGSLNAMHNVCRHRGAELFDTDRGNCGRTISCPYHGWTFGLDGELKGAPQMQPEADLTGLSLKPVWVDEWHGLVFVCLAPERPSSVAEQLTGTVLEQYQLANAKVVFSEDTRVEANWKVMWENGLECYHCAINHPELQRVVPVTRSGPQPDHVELGDFDFRPYFPLLEGRQSPTLHGDYESKLLGDPLSPPDSVSFLQWHASIFEIIAAPDHAHVMTYLPINERATLVRTRLLAHVDAVKGEDLHVDELLGLHRVTRQQDNDLCERVQRGVQSPAYEPGPYNHNYEFQNKNFVRLYRRTLAQDF
ncbi:aromatic ring-hydroxylating oxygenase subunit alpha [Streptomyces sp. GTA36]